MISKENTRMNITLPRDLVERLDAAAAYWGQSRSDYIADLVRYDIGRGSTAQARQHDIEEQTARLYGKVIFAEGGRNDG